MDKEPSWADSLRLVGQLGFEIALPLVGGAWGGHWLDQRFNTSPTFLLLGVVVAVILSTLLVAYKIKQLLK